MDLWILNQNKDRLKKCDDLCLYQCDDYCEINSDVTLGTYGTIDTARSILNDISQKLNEGKDLVYTLPSDVAK